MSKKTGVISFIIILLGAFFLVFFEMKKEGFHEDEIYSITSSISEVWKTGLLQKNVDEVPVWKTKEEVLSKLIKNENNHSTLVDVYQNQVADVHPPFFYFCSHFFLLMFSNLVFHAIFLLNLVFYFLVNWILILILKKMKKEKAIIPTLLFYDFSIVMLNTFTFQRMYGMLTFFGLSYFYLNLKIAMDDFAISKKTAILLFLTTLFGFLTQYFFVIYALVLFVIQMLHMFKQKKNASAFWYFLIHVGAALFGLLLFPSSISHILFGGRGVGSFLNLHYFDRLRTFFRIILENMNVSWYIIFVLLGYSFYRHHDHVQQLLLIPIFVYFFLIVQIVPFLEIRYIMMIMPLLMLSFVLVLSDEIHPNFAIGVVICLSILGIIWHEPQFLYSSYSDAKKASETYHDYSMVLVTDNTFTYLKEVPEMIQYQKTIVINLNHDEMKYLEDDVNIKEEGSFVLRFESYLNGSDILEQLATMGYEVKEKLFENQEQVGYVMEVRNA